MSHLVFLKQIMKNPRQVGAISQSSPSLARRIAAGIGQCTRIIELGPGAGVVTREILKLLPPEGRLTSVEINPHLCEYLRQIEDDRFTVVQGDAAHCEQHDPECDCVVSALPLTLFEQEFVEQILDIGVRIQRFVQLQYMPLLTKQLKQRFHDVRIHFVPLNLPPACVYVCQDVKVRC